MASLQVSALVLAGRSHSHTFAVLIWEAKPLYCCGEGSGEGEGLGLGVGAGLGVGDEVCPEPKVEVSPVEVEVVVPCPFKGDCWPPGMFIISLMGL